jgi:hypothetical protein
MSGEMECGGSFGIRCGIVAVSDNPTNGERAMAQCILLPGHNEKCRFNSEDFRSAEPSELQIPNAEEIWERHSRLVEVIEADLRDFTAMMSKRDFLRAVQPLIERIARLKAEKTR